MAPLFLKTIALLLPSGWVLKALHQLISFGSGLSAVLLPPAVLRAFRTATRLLAIRFFRN